jgi:hypothetical protein
MRGIINIWDAKMLKAAASNVRIGLCERRVDKNNAILTEFMQKNDS